MLYNFGIYLYGSLLHIGALFHPKAKKWVKGRKNFFQSLPDVSKKKVVWFHCASLGEYDQGLPIMEEWKKKHPNDFVLVTFFSPSGYENIIHKSIGDYTCYLPLDTVSNAKKFVNHFKPKKAFFIKYEVWVNYLNEAKSEGCELYAISANYRENQRFFKWYGGKFKRVLQSFDHIFVQYANNIPLLDSIGVTRTTVSGDTRYDRVTKRVESVSENEIIAPWAKDEDIFIMGSSWPKGEEIILPLINDNSIQGKVIIAPHEIDDNHIQQIIKGLDVTYQLYTKLLEGEELLPTTRVIILDCIGVLAEAYKYGSIAYVGGGFGTGLHNILEPAAFGLPVIFGPEHSKFPEGQSFIDAGIGISITDKSDFLKAYNSFKENSDISKKVSSFILSNKGATDIILKYFD